MKHATPDTLLQIPDLLGALRGLPELKERTTGVFYYRSKAFLHFHEDDGMLYADVRLKGGDFDRMRVKTVAEQKRLIAAIRKTLQ